MEGLFFHFKELKKGRIVYLFGMTDLTKAGLLKADELLARSS